MSYSNQRQNFYSPSPSSSISNSSINNYPISSNSSSTYLPRSYLSVPPPPHRDQLPPISPTTSNPQNFTSTSRRSAIEFNNGIWIQPLPPRSRSPDFNSLPLPSAPIHRVYTLNCSHCSAFLTDRGMRAVLLLKPHVILFSTDAQPLAGPLESESDDLIEKSCLCLTQQLACYSCGNVVGYTIVQPCTRCTDSIQRAQRSANHHRFVFHQNDITAKERLYYPGEEGVKLFVPVSSRGGGGENYSGSRPSSHGSHHSNSSSPSQSSYQELDTEQKELSYPSSPSSYSNTGIEYLSPTSTQSRSPSPAFVSMKAGDLVYWHHLVPGDRSVSVDPDSRTKSAVERPAR